MTAQNETPLPPFGHRITTKREALGWTKTRLAEESWLTEKDITRIESNGESTIAEIMQIARALNTVVSDITGWTPPSGFDMRNAPDIYR